MLPQLQPGSYVVYDTYGICKVNEIKGLSLVKGSPVEEYYVLTPLNSGSSTYYVPLKSEAALNKFRPPLTKKEIEELLVSSRNKKVLWTENRQARNEHFQNILASGLSSELLELIGCLLRKKAQLPEKGKKLSYTDEGFLVAAEKLINEEFSFSLGIPVEAVGEYILSFINSEHP